MSSSNADQSTPTIIPFFLGRCMVQNYVATSFGIGFKINRSFNVQHRMLYHSVTNLCVTITNENMRMYFFRQTAGYKFTKYNKIP